MTCSHSGPETGQEYRLFYAGDVVCVDRLTRVSWLELILWCRVKGRSGDLLPGSTFLASC